MALHIYLSSPTEETRTCECPCCDHKHEIKYFPEIEAFNITHNLAKMAHALGVYNCIWRPEENGIECAAHMIYPLEIALNQLERHPEEFKKFNAENGWGTYEGFLSFIKAYLKACEENPTATIRACR